MSRKNHVHFGEPKFVNYLLGFILIEQISPRDHVVLDVVGWVSLLYAESRLFRAHFPSISLPKLSLKTITAEVGIFVMSLF